MTVLVTGATGLLGGAVVEALLAEGTPVRALVRDEARASALLDGGVELVVGDVTDVPRWEARLAGVRSVVHCAAYFREYYAPGRHEERLHRVNVEAVGEVLQAAARYGVESVVHISTIGVTGAAVTTGTLSAEDRPPDPESLTNGYHRSKWESEQLVEQQLQHLDLRVPIVRPGWLFGPGDAAPTASGRLVLDAALGKLPAVPPGGNHATDARDVAQVLLAAARDGRSGRAYHAAAPWRGMADLVGVVCRAADVRAPGRQLRPALATGLAAGMELAARVTGRPPLATRHGIAALMVQRRVDSSRAVEELHARFRPFEETAVDEIEWYRAHGMLPRPVLVG